MRSFRHVSSFCVLRHVWFWHVYFGMFKYFLLSACCIPHTHTCGQVLVLLVVERQGSTAFQPRCAAQTWQILFLACRLSSCRSCRSVLVALAQLEVADNSSSTHTTTTQLQLVSQGKDAVIGSSLVAQFHIVVSEVFADNIASMHTTQPELQYNQSVNEIGHLHAKRRSFRHVSS